MKLLISLIFISIFLSSCGVDTSSSDSTSTSESTDASNGTVDDQINPINPIDPNPVVVGSTDPTDPTDPTVQANSIFDIAGAIEDKFACIMGDYNDGYTNNIIKDTSDDYLGAIDIEDGVGISSRYPYNTDKSKTEVALFYYDLKPRRSMDVKSFLEDNFTISIDTAWADNDETVIYVRTPENSDGLFSCYRYDAKIIDVDGEVTITKVYRLNEIN